MELPCKQLREKTSGKGNCFKKSERHGYDNVIPSSLEGRLHKCGSSEGESV